MTTQFPEYPETPELPDHAVRSDREEPPPAAAPTQYTSGTAADNALAVQPLDVAKLLRLPLPLDSESLYVITQAVQAAQSDVEAYLGRPAVPLTYTDHARRPDPAGWYLENYPVLSIVSYTAETDHTGRDTGLYTVTYVAGLDTVNDPQLFPIARFIKLHACYDPFVQIIFRQLRGDIATRVTSGSTEGQSATISDALPVPSNSGRMSSPAAVTAQMSLPGSPPTLQTLDKWRLGKRRVYQRPTRPGQAAPWPYDPPMPGTLAMWAGTWQSWW